MDIFINFRSQVKTPSFLYQHFGEAPIDHQLGLSMVKVEPGSERKNIVPICSNDIQWLVQRFASGQLMINPIIGFESVQVQVKSY